MSRVHPRILAIDPGTVHMGVAVLEGPNLIHYSVRSFRKHRPAHEFLLATNRVLDGLIRDYRPAILAYEKTFYTQAKASALLNVQEAEVKRIGTRAGLRIVGYSPTRVRKLLCEDGRADKRRVAEFLAVRFPELAEYRKAETKRRERYWSNMFDAVAVGAVCADGHAGGQG